ncbi:hypothetical protein I308_104795 [Cryptococcus tetragattii IND107]|uniref:Large ribosomal subunit protein uL29m n=1 Tax=Cryptococcus tetragattii IND107 TaxID=1296105 RepID=A0ABR3BPG3_9TREE|nr:hypothetical protein I308_01391 [Cryptococcus tetragattii IND107]
MSRLPRLSTLTHAFRRMHTEGRQIDHNGPSTPPPHHSPPADPSAHAPLPQPVITDAPPLATPEPRFTRKGKPIFTRPARQVTVHLPSGYPEPTKYPPPPEYYEGLEEKRKEPHPLWQFFHVPVKSQGRPSEVYPNQGFGSLESLAPEDANLHSGRAWTAAELRQKSFKELHTLWYVLLRERNVLATQREERRRLGIGSRVDGVLNAKRGFRCRKSMARIKYVLNERRLGLIAAAGPHLPIDAPHIPWSSSPTTDPAGATAAIRGERPDSKRIAEFEGAGFGGSMQAESFIEDEDVAEEEVEARDEGFGGGKEAEKFVDEVEVKDGKVEKKE